MFWLVGGWLEARGEEERALFDLVWGWLEARGEEERATWRALFDRYIDEIMHFVKNQVTPAITVPHLHAIKMLTDFLTTAAAGVDLNFDETAGSLMLADFPTTAAAGVDLNFDKTAGVFAEKVFLFCVCWAFGGVLETADRHKLSQHLYTITDLLPQMHGECNTLFDYYPDETAMDWEPWASRVPDWSHPTP
ncbi:hypothetical protein T484DRAFT_1817138 [Baffinella frigidus]|nr:hypothetical protein T484DRAFT_1817138 [Cryptophyta sp. CCMP2293]